MRHAGRPGSNQPKEQNMSAVRQLARNLRLGEIALWCLYRPFGVVRTSFMEGGFLQQRKTEAGRVQMEEAAGRIPELIDPGNPLPLPINFLSGNKYWYQTLFCIVSLQQNIERRVEAVVFDDGSFTDPFRDKMLRVVPWLKFVSASEVAERLDSHLPHTRFPSLRARRIAYPHLRKLTDIHCGASNWTVVFDSDMLMFRRPDALLDWMSAPSRPIFMQDVADAYGYSPALLEALIEGDMPKRVNVGLYSAQASDIDWDKMEYWCREQLSREGPHYLQEQALVAMLLGQNQAQSLPSSDYVVMPDLSEGIAQRAVLHHYVAQSKRSYYQHGWQEIAKRAKLLEE